MNITEEQSQRAELAQRLSASLHPTAAPVGIAFRDDVPDSVAAFDAPMPPPSADGRTGRVPAGCVFWMHAATRSFSTVAADHGNCSVGSLTHGLIDLDQAATRGDVAALVEAGWVTPEVFPMIPTVSGNPRSVTYGPLADLPLRPEVVLVRMTAKSLMVLHDAVPGLRIEGKPQCHIVAMAKESDEVAASVGCMLSRTRTGMPAGEVTAAIPMSRLAEVVEALETTAVADTAVATYAAADAARFA